MSQNSNIRIRPAVAADEDFIISLVPRLAEFGPPPWRDAAQMTATDIDVLRRNLLDTPSDTAIFIAEETEGRKLGFIHLKPGSDYYESEPHGHISDIIVAPAGEGRGLGRLLMAHAEKWARDKGYRRLTLSVFAQNTHAREVYQKLGYGEDIIKYVKEID